MLGQNEDFFSSLDSEAQLAFIDDDIMDGLLDDDSRSVTQYAKVKRYREPKAVKYRYAQDAAREIGIVATDEHVDMIVSGDFIAGDFIEAYLEQNKLIASEIVISTLSLSSENVDSLLNIKNHYLSGRMGLIISDYFFAYERKDGVEDIIKHLSGDDFLLAVAGVHTKITLIKTECGHHFVMGGSANLRSSMCIEQITIDNNAALYAFHRQWMASILNDYRVKHKMIRRQPLWEMVATNAAPAEPGMDSARRN